MLGVQNDTADIMAVIKLSPFLYFQNL